MENFVPKIIEKNQPVISDSVKEYFEKNTSSTREILVIGKFISHIERKKLELDFTDTPENIETLKTFLTENRSTKQFIEGASLDEIIDELRKSGLITESIIEKTIEEPKHIETEYQKLNGLTESESNLGEKDLGRNIETSKSNSFSKEKVKDLGNLYEDRETSEWEYYYEFVVAGLISEEDAKKDYQKIQEVKSRFNQGENLDEKDKERLEFAKQIAVITEKGIESLVGKIKIFGENIKMKMSSEFTDILRGVDSVIEITKDDGDMDFIGIATDVTFRRIEDIAFKDKFFSVLKQIKKNWKTKVKYEKNSKGELMKEFVVPKILLHFNMDDVRLCVDVLDKSTYKNDDELREEFKDVEQKTQFLQQIIFQCKLLSKYAEENKNSIFRQYDTVLNSITELSWKNPEIKEALAGNVDEKMKNILNELIVDFESNSKNWE